MTEDRARERLIERLHALPYREPDKTNPIEVARYDLFVNERFAAMCEAGDYNAAHPGSRITGADVCVPQ